MGISREDITGVMPLYLFKEHWNIAKRKIQPVFGFMATLDIMGYTKEQLNTIPFLILERAYAKHSKDPNESNKKILDQVRITCNMILESNKVLRDELKKQIKNFINPADPKTSTRT